MEAIRGFGYTYVNMMFIGSSFIIILLVGLFRNGEDSIFKDDTLKTRERDKWHLGINLTNGL